VSKVLLVHCAVQLKLCLVDHQKTDRQVWSVIESDDRTASDPLRPDQSDCAVAVCIGEDSGHCRPCRSLLSNTPQACRSPRTAAEGRRNSGNVLGCAKWGRPARCLFIRHGLTIDGAS
jgi:hypothetical protein